jgi:hypothetical protein
MYFSFSSMEDIRDFCLVNTFVSNQVSDYIDKSNTFGLYNYFLCIEECPFHDISIAPKEDDISSFIFTNKLFAYVYLPPSKHFNTTYQYKALYMRRQYAEQLMKEREDIRIEWKSKMEQYFAKNTIFDFILSHKTYEDEDNEKSPAENTKEFCHQIFDNWINTKSILYTMHCRLRFVSIEKYNEFIFEIEDVCINTEYYDKNENVYSTDDVNDHISSLKNTYFDGATMKVSSNSNAFYYKKELCEKMCEPREMCYFVDDYRSHTTIFDGGLLQNRTSSNWNMYDYFTTFTLLSHSFFKDVITEWGQIQANKLIDKYV